MSTENQPRRRPSLVASAALWALEARQWLRNSAARRHELSRAQRAAAAVVFLALCALAGVVLTFWSLSSAVLRPSAAMLWTVGAGIGASVGASVLAVGRLRHWLGMLTGAALVALGWGFVLGAAVTVPGNCPVSETGAAGRCGVEDIATAVTIGMLFVVALVLIVYPPYGFTRAGRAVRRGSKRAVAWAEERRRPKRRDIPKHQGRVTVSPKRRGR